jgi:hypothetical protein
VDTPEVIMTARRITRSAALGTLLLAAAVAGSACATTGQPAAEEERTTIEIQNQGFLDANVFVLRGSQRTRLGTVPGVSTRTFTLPRGVVFGGTTLRFVAEPIGSRASPTSHEIVVHPGDELRLVLRGF